jgi:CBS domain-containing protein
MKVREAMHQGAQWVSPDTSIRELARLMREHDIGSVPIGENDRLVGMVTDRDIVCRGVADGKNLDNLKARDVMSEGIFYCREDADLQEAVRLMEEKQIRRLPVIDQNKRMVGILALGDISHAGPRNLSGEVLQAVSRHH